MILEVLAWIALLDAVAAAAMAAIVYLVGRRTGHPVPVGSAVGIGLMLALPAAFIFAVAWVGWRIHAGG